MQFFKETKSYQFVTLLEKLKVERKYMNIFIYELRLLKLDLFLKRKIKKDNNINNRLELIISLFKERYYLEQLKGIYTIKKTSIMNSNVINNIIVSEIVYDGIKIYIEYGLMDNKYSIYILKKDNKGINLTENELQYEYNYNICTDVLNILSYEVCLILGDLLLDTIDTMRRVRKNV